MDNSEVDKQKQTIREEMLNIRKNLSPKYKAEADKQICEGIIANLEFSSNSVVAVYSPMEGEVNIQPLIDYLYKNFPNITVCYPYVDKGEIKLIRITEGREAPFIKDPLWKPDEKTLEDYLSINFERLTSAIVPMVAFDKDCNRLGHGGGSYDGLLAKLRTALTIGVAYKEQKVDHIPCNSHDQQVSLVISNGKNKWQWYGDNGHLK